MATLYELTQDWIQLMNLLEDGADEDVINDTLEGLDYEIEDKAEGYAKVIRNIESDIAGLKAEIERMTDRKRILENNITRMKNNLQAAMELTGKTKFKTDLFSFNVQANPAAVIMDEQYLENIPEEYLIPQEPKLDKKKLAADLKAGVDLEGIAHLEQSRSLRIK